MSVSQGIQRSSRGLTVGLYPARSAVPSPLGKARASVLSLKLGQASLIIFYRGEALFRCARPSGVPRGPATSTGSLASQRHPGLCCPFPSPGRPHPRPRPAPNPPTSPPRAGFGHLRPAAWPHSSMGSDPSVPCSACFLDQRPTVFLLRVSLPGLRRRRAGCWWNPTP